MLKLFKYLKNSIFSILLIVILLVMQAVCDLSLPDYTSKIVNVGIQQSGIESATYSALTSSTMDKLLLFISDDDKEFILNNYTLLSKESLSKNDYEKYLKKYPLLDKSDIYILNNTGKKNKNKISDIFMNPTYLLATLSAKEGAEKTFEMLSFLDKNGREKFVKEMKIDEIPDSIISGTVPTVIKAEYKMIGINTDSIQTRYILISGAKMLGIALFSMITTIIVGLVGARLSAKLGKKIREEVFEKVVSFSKTEIKGFGTASLITRTTNDVQQIQMVLVMLLRVVFYAPIIGVGGVIKSLNANSSMAWIIAVGVMAILTLVITLFGIVMPKFKIFQTLVDKLNLVTREILTGLPVIRAFSNEKHEEKRFDKANKDLTKNSLFVSRVMSLMMPMMTLIMNGICILIIWKGAYAVDAGKMQVGDMMAFIQYTMQIIMAFLMISMISIMLPRASVSAKRILEILNTNNVINDPESSKEFDKDKKGYVEFKNVCFRYPDASEDVISDINFTAMPGTTTAFIGSTGSGKSTLINLIPRFYDVTEGAIYVDGVDIRDVKQKDLRAKIGYVPQKGLLFTGDIASNIKYGRENISDKDMVESANIAQASEFINNFEEKYHYPIAQGGTNVSGGQKQRLSIARAIAIKPDIYIFDDSFSALDFKTDARLRQELKKVTQKSTVFIVAQRISTIMNADQIIVLNEGKVVGKGTHDELMKKCDVYKEIALSQLSKEELENA